MKGLKKKILKFLTDNSGCARLKQVRKCVLSEFDFDKEAGKSRFLEIVERMIASSLILKEGKKVKLVSDECVDSISGKNTSNLKKRKKQLEGDDGECKADLNEYCSKKSKNSGNKNSGSDGALENVTDSVELAPSKVYPPIVPKKGKTTLLLFYAYCCPQMTRAEQDNAIARCYAKLSEQKCFGRLRVAREGYNSTLTGSHDGIRSFTAFLREFDPATFDKTDFKYVDNLPDNQMLKELKVWPVTEIVTYGFDPEDAPLDMRGTHLKPEDFHRALEKPNTVVIDVRNFNETIIGKFAPPAAELLDPCMRRSTEFPKWVEDHKKVLEGKQVSESIYRV